MDIAIPYGRHTLEQDDIDSVVKVLKSDYLTQGPNVPEFEESFSKYVKSKYATAVNNGTAALHLCVLALGLKPGDKVICPTISFAASANCVEYCGGEVIFCDIEPKTFLIDLKKLESILNQHQNIKGIISVDFAGMAVDLQELKKIANKYNLWIVQDSCHAPGGYFINSSGNKENCGNGIYADLAIFSFHPVKHIACGEGGMITTNNPLLDSKIKLLRSHGITKSFSDLKDSINFFGGKNKIPSWYYEMQILGYNYRLTEFQAALGISQLKKAEKGIYKRKQIAKRYFQELKDEKWLINQTGIVNGHAYHLYIIQAKDRDGLYNYLKENNVFCQIHYFPIHLMPFYLSKKVYSLPESENYIKTCLSLPIYPGLSEEMQNKVISLLKKYYEKE